MAKTYTAVPNVSTLQTYASADYNTYTATNISNLIVPPLLRVRRATTQSIPNAVDTFVTWTIEDVDTDGCFTASSDTITIQTAGFYFVSASVLFAASATGYRVLNVYKNPSSAGDFNPVFASSWIPVNSGSQSTVCVASAAQSFAVGDTIKVGVAQSSGGALNIGEGTTFINNTQLSVAWVGRTS